MASEPCFSDVSRSSPWSLLSSRTALRYTSVTKHVPVSWPLFFPLPRNFSPRSPCGFLTPLPHVFMQVSPSQLHPPRPRYLKFEDPRLILDIELPCLLVPIVFSLSCRLCDLLVIYACCLPDVSGILYFWSFALCLEWCVVHTEWTFE